MDCAWRYTAKQQKRATGEKSVWRFEKQWQQRPVVGSYRVKLGLVSKGGGSNITLTHLDLQGHVLCFDRRGATHPRRHVSGHRWE